MKIKQWICYWFGHRKLLTTQYFYRDGIAYYAKCRGTCLRCGIELSRLNYPVPAYLELRERVS